MYLRHLLRRHHHLLTTFPRLTTTSTTTTTAPKFLSHTLPKPFHSTATATSAATAAADDAAEMNEFLSRFVHSMRSKLTDSYPTCDKPTIDSMLVLVVDKLVSEMDRHGGASSAAAASTVDFGNEELTKTMWEVSNTVYHEMEREKTKEKMKKYLQSEEVKSMARFASEIGVRGDMLREMRFKWAKEVMEDAEFYSELNELKEQQQQGSEHENEDDASKEVTIGTEGGGTNALPKRHGRINYKLYGLDLSGEKWREVAEKVHEAEEVVWPAEAKAITGKCKVITEQIVWVGLDEDEGRVSELIEEWVELLHPNKVDWFALLENVKSRDYSVYLKMAERVLAEPSFQSDIRDYSLLIHAHAKEKRTKDVERLLKKMSEKGLAPDVLTLTALLHLYSKTNNLDQANEAYKALKSQGFKPDMEIYNSMITAYVNAGQPNSAEKLVREMELREKPSEEIYMSLLQAFAQQGDTSGAQRIVSTMEYASYRPTAESYTLLIQACAKSGKATEARNYFEDMMTRGYKPDDKNTSMLISAYEEKNELDNALSLLLKLEKDGFVPGISTYCVLVDWLGKLQLIDEAEQILAKIAQLGEAPPLKLQVSLCDMYARAGIENKALQALGVEKKALQALGFEKKALQALGVLEAKKDLLEHEDFERIITGLLNGGFVNDANRIQKLMEARGFTPSNSLKLRNMATQSFRLGSDNNGPGAK